MKRDTAESDRTARPDGGSPVPVGVKLGSTRTVLAFPAADGSGVRTVRTLTCLASYENPITGETKYAYGDDAAAEYPDSVVFPLRAGLPDREKRTERTQQFFDAVVDAYDVPERSVVVYATPSTDDQSGQRNLRRIVERSRIGSAGIERYPEGLCGSIPALGSGLDAVEAVFVALNLGATGLEIAAYRRGEQLSPYRTGAVSGNEVDRQIVTNVENETQGRVHIDINTAREYKERHADFEQFEPVSELIQQPGGGRHEFTLEWSVMDAVETYLEAAVEKFTDEYLPQLSGSHLQVYRLALDQPVVLTGGMACLPGISDEFERAVRERTGEDVSAIVPKRAELAAAVGAYRIATRLAE